jgi:predicted metal-dependent peptidase
MMNVPKTDAELTLTKARTRLLKKLVFFGQLALKLGLQESTQTQTMATDGKHIYYNPAWVETVSVLMLAGVILHEVLHVIFMHPLRRGGRNHERWNIACDLAINPIITRHGFELPDGALDEWQFHSMTAEQIYKQLDQTGEWESRLPPTPQGEGEQEDGDGTQSGADQMDQSDTETSSEGSEGGPNEGDDSESGDSPTDGGESGEPDANAPPARQPRVGEVWDATSDDGSKLTKSECKKLERIVARDIFTAKQTHDQIGRGYLGAEIDAQIKEISKAEEVDWRVLLRRNVIGAIEKSDTTWARPNRRHIHSGLYLPGDSREGCGEIVVVIDTSGSTMGYHSLFLHEIKLILDEAQPELVHVIYCDDDVTHTEELVPPVEFTYRARGGGGTSFRAPFQWVEDRFIEPECLIYLTDGYGEPPVEEPEYPVIWATCGTGRRFKWGEVIGIDDGEARAY